MFTRRLDIERRENQFPPVFDFGYDNLVVSGCSFTYNDSDVHPVTWPYYLKELGNFKSVYDCSLPGAGNYHISHSLRWCLFNENINSEHTLIIVMISGHNRDDTVCNEQMLNTYPFKYLYVPNVASAISGGDETNSFGNTVHDMKNVTKIKNRHARAIENFLYLDAAKTWLDHRGYRSVFIDHLDPKFPSRSNDFNIAPYLPDRCQKRLRQILADCQDPYSFCLKNNLFDSDDYHPSIDGHLQWTKSILIPYLKSLDI